MGSNTVRRKAEWTGVSVTDAQGLIHLKTWPQAESVVLKLLAELGVTVAPAQQVTLMEFEPHVVAAPQRFEAAVKAGLAPDTADGFVDFASRDFKLFLAFQRDYPVTELEPVIVPLADLRANPIGWLPYLLYWLAPKNAALAEAPETAARLEAWQAAHSAPEPAAFRYYDANVFKHLSAITLAREDVEAIFQDLLGRSPSLKGALGLQTQPSLGHLRAALMGSPEYLNRQPPPQSAAGPTTQGQRDDFPGFAAAFDRLESDLAVTQPKDPAAARAKAEAATAAVLAAQQSYQPFYGLDDPKKSGREALLRASCDLLTREFAHVQRKSQIRILDVGCNAGFASFVLAETFPNTIGFDVNSDNVALCKALKAHSGSPVMFFEADLMEIADKSAAEFEALDAVLFLNVIHQLIFARGIPYVKTMLGQLSRHVDLIVVELSRPAEYIPFGKDHLLPIEVVARFRPVCSLVKVDQGFISGC